MNENQVKAHARAAKFLAICRNGFSDPFQHKGWLRKHRKEIDALPPELRDAVLLAHDQASTPQPSGPKAARSASGKFPALSSARESR